MNLDPGGRALHGLASEIPDSRNHISLNNIPFDFSSLSSPSQWGAEGANFSTVLQSRDEWQSRADANLSTLLPSCDEWQWQPVSFVEHQNLNEPLPHDWDWSIEPESQLQLSTSTGQAILFNQAWESSPASPEEILRPITESYSGGRDLSEATSTHGFLFDQSRHSCQECNSQFPTKVMLDSHAKATLHAPYGCLCGKHFSRIDVLKRHIQSLLATESYPCPHCKKHRGPQAFTRHDHLTQHLRNHHKIEPGDESEDQLQQSPRKKKKTFSCHHDTCSYRPGFPPQLDDAAYDPRPLTFPTRGELTRHLREVHDESLFPCLEIGCPRVGGKGYFRKRDLSNHAKDHHPTS